MGYTKVGILGYNEGNGHPYSFSAIINGYNSKMMGETPFSVIEDYLSNRKPEEFGIGNLKVTQVWAPDRCIAENIASFSYIDNVVKEYKDMIDEIDVVIIARDDPESHKEIASFFLEKGKIVFVDKPLCNNLEELKYFMPWIREGKLMSCSGFRYYPSIINEFEGKLEIDDIIFSNSIGINDWFKYGIHLLEGITPIFGDKIKWVQNIGYKGNNIVRVEYENGKYALLQVNNDLGFILRSSFYSVKTNHITIDYDDNFSCFRNLLHAFNKQIMTGNPAIDPDETETIIKAMIAGNKSIEEGGRKVNLKELNS